MAPELISLWLLIGMGGVSLCIVKSMGHNETVTWAYLLFVLTPAMIVGGLIAGPVAWLYLPFCRPASKQEGG